jgi:hypothetical protein
VGPVGVPLDLMPSFMGGTRKWAPSLYLMPPREGSHLILGSFSLL